MATTWMSYSLMCFVLLVLASHTHGQCTITNLRVSLEKDIRWDCDQLNNEFRVKYHVLDLGRCDYGIRDNDPIFEQIISQWQFNEKLSISYNSLYPNSTYRTTVQARVWQQDRYLLGIEHEGLNWTTGEGLGVSGSFKHPSTGSFSWRPYPYVCVDDGVPQNEYLLISVDGKLAREGVTNATKLDLTDLECATVYRFLLTYQTKTGNGPDKWLSIRIGLPRTSSVTSPKVQLNSTSNTSLIFTWDTHSPCNTQNDTQVMYEYELKRQSDNAVVHSATQMETLIVFNDLEPGTSYKYRVRISAVVSSGGSYYSNWIAWISASTTSSTTTSLPVTTTSMIVTKSTRHLPPTTSTPPAAATLSTHSVLLPSEDTTVQSRVQNLRVRDFSQGYVSITWDTTDFQSEFQVIYQLLKSGLCSESAGDGKLDVNFNRRTTSWTSFRQRILYYIDDGLYANSTYLITVQSRVFDGSQYVYRPQHSGVIITTAEEIKLQISSYNNYQSVKATWNAIPDSCLNFQYVLLKPDGTIVKEGTVTTTDIILIHLECDTDYQFKMRYTMNMETSPWSNWLDQYLRTPFPDPSEFHVRVKAITPRSVTFTWQPLQCNSKTYTTEYHYELQLLKPNQEAVQGVLTDTEITFNNLEIDGEYGFRMSQRIFAPTEFGDHTIPWTDWIYAELDDLGNIISNHDYRVLIGAGLGAILIAVIIIGLIIARKRTERKPNQDTQASDEADNYAVNLAMEGRTSTSEPSDYQEVNDAVVLEEEGTRYQGLNLNNMETEHEYQGLGGTN
ncbi:uncharacterized protein [Amphiura filiformis]|uniref:uncharacterized protein n=1 Tax=Amphiura filiformis TaxID=82378 RepID=UPI003B20BD52